MQQIWQFYQKISIEKLKNQFGFLKLFIVAVFKSGLCSLNIQKKFNFLLWQTFNFQVEVCFEKYMVKVGLKRNIFYKDLRLSFGPLQHLKM